MRGDKRCGSFRKEKPAGLSRALSWLSVSSISRQSRRIFHSQNELHSAHNRQTHSHLYGPDSDEEEDEDNWVYQPQHKTGEDEPGKENQQRYPLQIRVYRCLHSSCRRTRPANHRTCLSWLNHSVIADLHSMDFWSGRQRMTVYMRMQSKKWVTVSFYGAPSPSSLPHNILSDPGVCEIIVGWEWGQRVLCACNR